MFRGNKLVPSLLVFVIVLLATLPFVQAKINGVFIDQLIRAAGAKVLSQPVFIFAALILFLPFARALLRLVSTYLDKRFYLSMDEKLEYVTLEKRREIDLGLNEDSAHKDLFEKVQNECIWRSKNFVNRLIWMSDDIIQLAIATGILIFARWWVPVVLLAASIPQLFVEIKYGDRIWSIWGWRGELQRKYSILKNHIEYTPWFIETKIFDNLEYFLKKIKALFDAFQNETWKNDVVRIRRSIFATAIAQGANIGITALFIAWVISGELSIGTFLFLTSSLISLQSAFNGIFANLGELHTNNLFVTDLMRFLNLKPSITNKPHARRLAKTKTPRIVFDHVWFSYPGSATHALKDISFTLNPGEKLALVGSNGAGKTTLIKLLCRFYDPTRGSIFLDGVDLRDVKLETWHALVGTLFQEYANYRFLAKESIAVGKTDIRMDMDRVRKAAHESEADTFIEPWKYRYQQQLGREFTEGVEPSVGQWQKLALSRVFYRDPRIYILDEPTSSIDPEAEEKIFAKLENLPNDASVILISHRFSTVRHAHAILVIEHGEITESGTHEELLARDKTYARLFKLQAKGYR